MSGYHRGDCVLNQWYGSAAMSFAIAAHNKELAMDIMKLRIHLRTKCAHLRLPVLVVYGPAFGGCLCSDWLCLAYRARACKLLWCLLQHNSGWLTGWLTDPPTHSLPACLLPGMRPRLPSGAASRASRRMGRCAPLRSWWAAATAAAAWAAV